MKVVQKISLRYIWRFFVSSNRESSDLIALVSHYCATFSRRKWCSFFSWSRLSDSILIEVHFMCHQPSFHNFSISPTPLNLRPPGFCFRAGNTWKSYVLYKNEMQLIQCFLLLSSALYMFRAVFPPVFRSL